MTSTSNCTRIIKNASNCIALSANVHGITDKAYGGAANAVRVVTRFEEVLAESDRGWLHNAVHEERLKQDTCK